MNNDAKRSLPRGGRLRTAAVAALTVGGLVGVSFGLQAIALNRPDPASHLVIETVAKLEHYHRSRATILVNGSRLTAVCTQGWQHRHRVATVRLSDGRTLHEVRDELVGAGSRAEAEFELAACPRALTVLLANRLRDGLRIHVRPTRFEGDQAYVVSFPTAEVKISLVVPRRGGLPLGLTLVGRAVKGSSRVGFGAAVDAAS